jgi:hypothetical protein
MTFNNKQKVDPTTVGETIDSLAGDDETTGLSDAQLDSIAGGWGDGLGGGVVKVK